ncbi:MAG: hypothetical protein AB7O62_00490 [Pirellulales bacterium]
MGRMPWHWRAFAILCLAWQTTQVCLAVGPSAGRPRPPASLTATPDECREFIRQGQAFVLQHAASPDAPRVLLDIVGMALVLDDTPLANSARGQLLYDYPHSPAVPIVLAQSKDAEAFRGFLGERLDSITGTIDYSLAQKHCAAVDRGILHFGSDVLKGSSFATKTAMLARIAKLDALAVAGQEAASKTEDKDTKKVIAIVFDEARTNLDKVVALHGQGDVLARWCEKLLRPRLAPADAATRTIVRIDAENHLLDLEFAQALPIVEQLLAGGDEPSLRYFQVWSLAALDRHDEAEDALAVFRQAHPDSEWLSMAEEVAADRQAHGQRLLDYARDLAAVGRDLASGLDKFEATLEYLPSERPPFSLYVGYDASNAQLQASVARADKPLLAYRTVGGESWAYLGESHETLHLPGQGVFPIPSGKIQRQEGDSFSFNFNFQMSEDPSALGETQKSTLDSPYLSSGPGVLMLLKAFVPAGSCLGEPQRIGENVRYTWKRPRVDKAEFRLATCDVSTSGKLLAIELDDGLWRVSDIRYGRGTPGLKPPAWPDAPETEVAEIDASVALKLMTAVLSFWSDLSQSDSPDPTATGGTPP